MTNIFGDKCYRKICKNAPAQWYHAGTRAYYCTTCALRINMENHQELCLRHALCDHCNAEVVFGNLIIGEKLLFCETCDNVGVKEQPERKRLTTGDVEFFLVAYNRGEYAEQTLGRAFVNRFGHNLCPAYLEKKQPCIFTLDGGQAAKAIWEMVTE